MIHSVLTFTLIAVMLIEGAVTLYGLFFVVVVLLRRHHAPVAPPESLNRFLVLIPAHNESEVIGCLIDSLHRGDYPRDRYEVVVIADNCNDATAEEARGCGAAALERTSEELPGKQYAIEWALAELERGGLTYDALVVLDADNVASANLLSEANRAINAGADAVQAVIISKNPNDSWVSRFTTLSFACINRVQQPGRSALGINPLLCGTGMGITRRALADVGWPTATLKEDKELTIRLALKGYRSAWLEKTSVYDERPTTLSQSNNQLSRWYAGDIAIAVRYVPALVRSLFARPSLSKLDILIQLVIHLLFAKKMLLILLILLLQDYSYLYPFLLLLTLELTHYLAVVLVAKLPPVFYAYAVAQEGYKVLNCAGIVKGVTAFLLKKSWLPTRHSRKISIEDLNGPS
jgi:cellulose synthase/poly-beta-1,6-N-acetylglucosamine synthase-like glycosyltransferase